MPKKHISKHRPEASVIAIVNRCLNEIPAIHLPARKEPTAMAGLVLTADKNGNLWLNGSKIGIEQLRHNCRGQQRSVTLIPDKKLLVQQLADIKARLEVEGFRVVIDQPPDIP